MTYEELYMNLTTDLKSGINVLRAFSKISLDSLATKGAEAVLDMVDEIILASEKEEAEMLNKMAEDYEAEERREEEEFSLPYKIMDDESPG